MRRIDQSTAYNLMVLMVDSTDHVTEKTGLTLTITASKDGAAFASITPTVTELANGVYSLALTASHTDTLGDLAINCTGAGADPSVIISQVRLPEPSAADINLLHKYKRILNKADGTIRYYDSSGTQVYSCFGYMDAAMTQLYDGTKGVVATSELL